MKFYVGCHATRHAQHFEHACISVGRLRGRRRLPAPPNHWILDSGAFQELRQHGTYRHSVAEYAEEARRWQHVGELDAIVAQDWMCEPFILERTGLTVADHQRLTIDRYDELAGVGLERPIMAVLQGFEVDQYLEHLALYGDRLPAGAWVGVGSVCKRQGRPATILGILRAIHGERPDLQLHGFGVKTTALADAGIRHELATADSMAWNYAARREGRRPTWQEAERFARRIQRHEHTQPAFDFGGAGLVTAGRPAPSTSYPPKDSTRHA